MSTEKSLLTWDDVKNKITEDSGAHHYLYVPIGVDEKDNIRYVFLDDCDNKQHICLVGVCGSGKSTAVTWVLSSLQRMYRKSLGIWYVDGKDCESRQWKDSEGNPKFFCNGEILPVKDYMSMHAALVRILYYLLSKPDSSLQDVIVLDDVDYLIRAFTKEDIDLLSAILDCAPTKRAHILYTSQGFSDLKLLSDRLGGLDTWEAVCCTRVSDSVAMRLQGTDLAAKAVRKAGNVVVKSGHVIGILRVPFVNSHIIKDVESMVMD